MKRTQLRNLTKTYLLPLFSGCTLDHQARPSNPKEQLVGRLDACSLALKVARNDPYRLVIRRRQPFDDDCSDRVTEKRVVDAFVQVVQQIEPGLQAQYREDLLSSFQRRIVVKALVDDQAAQESLLQIIDSLSVLATRLYEGRPVTLAVVLEQQRATAKAPLLTEIWKKDFSMVLSNGYDTLLRCNFAGQVLSHEQLPRPKRAPSYAPYRLATIAHWATNGRIAIVLNKLGEMLFFRDRTLVFARRSGRWHFLTHQPLVTQMGGPDNRALRRAVYASCLDASFARSGACIGLVTSGNLTRWRNIATKKDDHLSLRQSLKSQTLARLVGRRRWQYLDRRLRQSLLAMDGAVLLDYNGNLLAVGAILKIPGGSTGGGRKAAARALSKLGVGIKVSQDGGILGFHAGNKDPDFYVMEHFG